MSPRSIAEIALATPPLLRSDQGVESAVRQLLEQEIPALPVVDERERYAGIFGEREFMGALFPGYLKDLKYAAFVSRSLDDVIEKRETCRLEPVGRHMTTEHVEVGPDFSDVGLAETFMHHRVLIVPVVSDGEVLGVIPRRAFFRALAERFVDGST